jgi:hypothetical protein
VVLHETHNQQVEKAMGALTEEGQGSFDGEVLRAPRNEGKETD